jgi:hypothetical protein
MTAENQIPQLERVLFFEGERLTAADLGAMGNLESAYRWQHNRSLHQWGIGTGFEVTGANGDRAVEIHPGYALDCLGRELVQQDVRVEPVPPVSAAPTGGEASYYLTAAYATDADLDPIESRAGLCGTSGATRLPEQPTFAWSPVAQGLSNEVMSGIEVVLAQIWLLNCKLSRPVSLEVRRSARPAQQPYAAAGFSTQTAWRFFPAAVSTGEIEGVEIDIDTTAAGFRQTPRYFASLQGSRAFSGGYVDGYTNVEEPTPSGFTLRVWLPRGMAIGGSVLNPAAVFEPTFLPVLGAMWGVAWVGIED